MEKNFQFFSKNTPYQVVTSFVRAWSKNNKTFGSFLLVFGSFVGEAVLLPSLLKTAGNYLAGGVFGEKLKIFPQIRPQDAGGERKNFIFPLSSRTLLNSYNSSYEKFCFDKGFHILRIGGGELLVLPIRQHIREIG